MSDDKVIYSEFLGHCEIARVSWMGRDTFPLPNTYSCRFESETVLSELVQRHEVDSLVKSGVVVRSEDGSPRLNDRLDGRGQIAIPLRADGSEQPFDIVLDNGCVSGKRLAASSILADRTIKEALPKFDNVLLVTQTLAEAGILQMCGIPAVVSAGLERLQEPYLSQFIRFFHLIPQKQMRSVFHPTSVRKSGPQLVLLLASLNDMSPTCPDSMRAVEVHLRQFALSSEWDCTGIKSWHPEDTFFDKLRFLANNGRSDYIRGLFQSSISRESRNLIPTTVPAKTGVGLREAFAK